MATSYFTVVVAAGDGTTPLTADKTQTSTRLRNYFHRLMGGNRIGTHTVRTSTATATGTVTCATVANSQTVTINGTALTATQKNSRGTVTAASASVADTVTVNGVVFTAAAAEDTTTGAFNQSGSDTVCAASLVACINANATLAGVVTAANAAAVVTIRAVASGTGGDALTLATSNNTRLAKSGTTLSGGAAISNNTFDFGGTNTQTGAALADAINASSTSLVSSHVLATAALGVVTLTALTPGLPGNATTLASSNGGTLAVSAARLAGGTETSFTY